MLKVSENPPSLPPGVPTLRDLAGTWWVAHTKPRNEKALAWDLLARRVPYFLPLYETVRFSGGRKRKVLLPLFPSYVFICTNEEGRLRVLKTNRLCRLLAVPDPGRLVEELASIEKALRGKAALDPFPHAAQGRRCRVTAGPFAGLEGIVVRRGRSCRVVLQVSFLSMGALMEIDAGLLAPQ